MTTHALRDQARDYYDAKLLQHGRLAVLPGTHGEYLGEIMTPKVSERTVAIFADLVNEFLDGRE